MKIFFHSRDGASKGAALMIVLAFVVLLAGVSLAYFSRTTTDRQLAQSSYNDSSADLLARTALDVIVGDFKQEILSHPTITRVNIQPTPYPIPTPSDIPNLIRYSSRNAAASRASSVSSGAASANGRSISLARWNSHYLIPLANPSDTASPAPTASFSPGPDWVLVTGQGPAVTPSPSAVIGRYAFAVYDEGGLLDMNLAGSPIWHANDTSHGWANLLGVCTPSPTPWLVNVGRKGILAFADLTALPDTSTPLTQTQVDNIVGWRNYATTLQNSNVGSVSYPSYGTERDCSVSPLGQSRQDFYGGYLLYFGDPPFTIENLSDKLLASIYPFTAVANTTSKARTDQSLTTRQELLKLRSSLGFSQNVLQYMGTFSRERNWPAPDWPNLGGQLKDGRFNIYNLALLIPNPNSCTTINGKKVGWQKGNNRNHVCGTTPEILDLFGLAWIPSDGQRTPGYWWYTPHTGPNPYGSPDPNYNSIICWDPNANRYQGRQADFFQILHYALSVGRFQPTRCNDTGNKLRTFAMGASLIDQYDSGSFSPGGSCIDSSGHPQRFGDPTYQVPGCDLDAGVNQIQYATHTTVIKFGQGSGPQFAVGMEKDYDPVADDGDVPKDQNDSRHPHRPCGGQGGDCITSPLETPAPTPLPSPGGTPATNVINHRFSNVGEFGYGMDTSTMGSPTPSPSPIMDFNPPTFYDAPVLDFFSYNPISSAYPRAGIVNLYTRNAPVLAAILADTLKTDAAASQNPPSPVISGTPAASSEAMQLASAIVAETQGVLAGAPPSGWAVTQTDMTRAIAARLAARASNVVWGNGTTDEIKKSVARALAEVGQTRTWNLFIDVIAQTGKYKPNSPDISGSNFIVEGEKRYWLHIALGRDLIHADGTPCQPGDTGCQVDVLGSQLEEVTE